MSNYKFYAQQEFRAAGWIDENGKYTDEMQGWICEQILTLLDVFADEGHSGSSAPYVINVFSKLAKFEPIAPLTGEDWEWNKVSDGADGVMYQNNRMGAVFKNGKDGKAYWLDGMVFWEWFKNIDGEVFKSHYTSRDSKVFIEFPWVKPESKYMFVPTAEYPNEVL